MSLFNIFGGRSVGTGRGQYQTAHRANRPKRTRAQQRRAAPPLPPIPRGSVPVVLAAAAYTSGVLLQHGSLPHMLLKSSFFFTQPASFSRTLVTLKYVYTPAEVSVMSEPQTRPTVSVGLPG